MKYLDQAVQLVPLVLDQASFRLLTVADKIDQIQFAIVSCNEAIERAVEVVGAEEEVLSEI